MADITGTSGSETLTGTEDADTINGLGGNDSLNGLGGADTLNGGEGSDTLEGGAGNDTLDGGNGTDTARYQTATSGVTVNLNTQNTSQNTGGGGVDTLISIENATGSNFADTLTGNSGNNTLQGLLGDDYIDGGDGRDTASYTSAANGVYVDLALQGSAQVTGVGSDTLVNMESISGSLHADSLYGDGNDNSLLGQAGDDELFGRGGDDLLYGLGGTDELDGGSGVDTAVFTGARSNYTITAGDGFYIVVDSRVGATADGTDYLTNIEYAQFADQTIALAPLEPPEVGEAVDDSLVVTSGIASSLDPMALLTNDTLWDGWSLTGLSSVTGGSAEIVDGRLVITATGPMSFDYTITGPSGSQTAHVTVTSVSSTNGIDSITAVYELRGADLVGLNGNDVLVGSGGWDRLVGGAGNDSLNGVDGQDLMIGGVGNDTYYVSEQGDTIVEEADGGYDTVYVQAGEYVMAANLEKAILVAAAYEVVGNTLDNTIIGNSFANEINGGEGADRMEGGAGNDTYYVDNVGDRVIDTAGDDTVITFLTSYTLGAGIETLRAGNLNWDFQLTGNASNNTLYGLNGDDRLDGRAGADLMNGGDGDDTYVIDNAGDVIVDSGGYDTIETKISYILASGSAVERVVASGASAIALTGNSNSNLLEGNAAGNTLDGGGGADNLRGHGGKDTYVVDHLGDVVEEDADEGVDTVRSSVTYTLGANLENLILTGSAADGTGNGLANVLTGNDLNNTLDGGEGADTLKGGLGDDTYLVDNAGDRVIETGSGLDTVRASISYTLAAGVEDLLLIGSAGLTGIGNGAANAITGGGGDDTLSGLGGDDILDGGAGADAMNGGAGNDTYVVDHAGDTIAESGGVDTVQTSLAVYALAAGIENLVYTGEGVFAGTGNALANTFTGGSGADTFIGLGGNDTYIVGAGDIVVEAADGGIDTVQTTLSSYTLGDNVEVLRFIGAGPFSGVGNAGNNAFYGGVNADTFTGLGGDDTYYIDAWDTVVEAANGGTDTIVVAFASAWHYLAANIDNITYVGDYSDSGTEQFVAIGNALNNVMIGSYGKDSLNGEGGDDILRGGDGGDSLWGSAGDDMLYGDAGRDFLAGDAGVDYLTGGAGDDYMLGNDGWNPGPSKDYFIYLATTDSGVGEGFRDHLNDFDILDILNLKAIDANTTIAGNQAFVFIGQGAFSGTAGELRYVKDGEGTHVFVDVNGDGVADMEILLAGSIDLTTSNFIL